MLNKTSASHKLRFVAFFKGGIDGKKADTIITMSAEKVQLLTDTESGDDATVSFDIVLLKICKKVSSLTYHHKKTAT